MGKDGASIKFNENRSCIEINSAIVNNAVTTGLMKTEVVLKFNTRLGRACELIV